MLKKTIIGLLIIVLIVGMMVMPVSAAIYDYNDYIVDAEVEGEKDMISVSFPTELNRWNIADRHDSANSIKIYDGVNTVTVNTSLFDDCPNDMFFVVYRPFGKNALRVDNIPNGSTLTTNIEVDVSTKYAESCLLTPRLRIQYYDSSGDILGSSRYADMECGQIGDYWEMVTGTRGTVAFNGSTTISKPEGAAYAQFWFYIDVDMWEEPDKNIYTFTVRDGGKMTFGVSSLYRTQQSTGQTNELLGNINENIEKLPGEMGDEFLNIIDQENQAASNAGDSNVGEVLEVVPDKSEGFMNAIQGFASSMSYTGTSATLSVPALIIPDIPGLIPKTVLWDGLELDFGQYIGMLPDGLLILVQSLLTIALIVYCFKELYDTIAYVMTLRKGST